jgi:uncharacterized protein YecT (DUF1311 family)
MARDRVAELAQVRKRAGKGGQRGRARSDLYRLKRAWEGELKGVYLSDELVPVRIVTILEVFIRDWIEELIDHGAPYVERASKLKVDLKYDFAIAHSLQGKLVSLGQLIADSVSLSRFEAFTAVFDTLLDCDLFDAISKTRDRMEVSWAERRADGALVKPIIGDIAHVKRALARLFNVRHILVHELPRNKPHVLREVSEFLDSAELFVKALDEELRSRLYGERSLTEEEMNRAAAANHQTAVDELDSICNEIALRTSSDKIRKVQRLWVVFKEAEAERQSEIFSPDGGLRPVHYSYTAEQITRTRIRELKEYLEDLTGE